MILFFSFLMISRAGLILKGFDMPPMHLGDIIVFFVWTALLLWPLFGEFSLFGFGFKKHTDSEVSKRRPEEVRVTLTRGAPPPDIETKELSEEALKVLSTLWKHQQQYDPQVWQFAVRPKSPYYGTYAIGVGETMKLGLTAINPENGMVFLTVEGINYCREHHAKLSSVGWDYSRWQR
jgi:hypothetical protein